MTGKKLPDYRLKLLDRTSGAWTFVGGVWRQSAGHLTITLSPGVVLSYRDMRQLDMQLTAFPSAEASNSVEVEPGK